MNMIEIYDENEKVSGVVNSDLVNCVLTERDGRNAIRVEFSNGEWTWSYETLENFRKRTGEQWVELESGENSIRVKKSEIVAYQQGKNCIYFFPRNSNDGFRCTESIESFEKKLGIKKEDAE